MRNIWVIARREVTRLRSRFTGRSRFFVFGILVFAALLSTVIYHHGPFISKAFYDIGVSPDGPPVTDARFHVLTAPESTGYSMLAQYRIDLFVPPGEVIARPDDQSQYTAGAFKQYIERQELLRLSEAYRNDLGRAFPLRVEVHHLDDDPAPEEAAPVPALKLLDPEEPGAAESLPTPSEGLQAEVPQAAVPQAPVAAAPEPLAAPLPEAPSQNATDEVVRKEIKEFAAGDGLPKFKAEFVSESEVIVPSLMTPPVPLAQVLIAFFYVVPVFFVSVFFTSSFMEEKTNRKLVILLSAPITPLQIILGKMLPYIGYAVLAIIVITVVLGGNVGLGLAIFLPVTLFVLSAYLMVALLYRTFKDQTFFSVLAVWIVTAYLVAPAMFTGVNDLSFISPLTLAVLMYRGESFTAAQYFLSTIPMYAVFAVTLFVGVRVFNEEYLMGFRPLYRKLAEAIALIITPRRLTLSLAFLSFILIPVVFMVQFAAIVIATNLSASAALGLVFVLSIVTEEAAKSAGIAVLVQNGTVRSYRGALKLAVASAAGFFFGEKLLLLLALSVVSDSMFAEALAGSGLFIAPLVMHILTTAIAVLVTRRLGVKYYPVGVFAGSVIHALYNLWVIYGIGGLTP